MPRLRCPRACCEGTLESCEDDDDLEYVCLSCSRHWTACPTPSCRGVLSQTGICRICHFGDDIVMFGAIAIVPELFAEPAVERHRSRLERT